MTRQSRQPEAIELMNSSRREIALGLLGALGGATALLSGCGTAAQGNSPSAEADPKDVALVHQAETGATSLRWFDKMQGTVADPGLANFVGSANDVVLLLGYYAPGDGGGGLFVWSKLSRVDNRGTTINPGVAAPASGAGWRRLYSGPLNVRWFGAKGDGATEDSRAIQAALDEVNAAGGGSVSVPAGTYVVDRLKIYSNTTLSGEGGVSILKQKSGSRFCLTVNAGDGGTPDVATNQRGITLRELCLLGTVEADKFAEHYHLLLLSAVTDVLIERCSFVGFRGDGIYIGSGDSGGAERHNENITIRKCLFDGVTNDNRQGISIIDGTSILIEDNDFTRCTSSKMPGAIDIEPNTHAYARIRDIRIINNRFTKIGGGVGVISLVLPLDQETLNQPMSSLTIVGNHISDCTNSTAICLLQGQAANVGTYPNGVLIENNDVIGCGYGISLLGVKGVRVANNRVSATTASPFSIGFTGRSTYDVSIESNYFYRCDTLFGSGAKINHASKLRIARNTFDSLGQTGGGFGYAMGFGVDGVTSFVTIEDNCVIPGGRTRWAIQVERGHKLSPETNRCRDNDLGGLGSAFRFTSPGSVLEVRLTVAVGLLVHGGTFISSPITLVGAESGDYVQVATGDLSGLQLSGYVSTKDTIKFTLSNSTGIPVTLPAMAYYIKVTKR